MTLRAATRRLGARIGVGLMAGLAGTALMSLAQKVETMISPREPSTAPADAIDEIAGIAPKGKEARQKMSSLAHWGYGTSLGAVRGILAGTPLPRPVADALFFGAVWSAPMAYLPALGVTPPPSEWGGGQIAKDGAHHLIYAVGVAGAWRLLTKP